MKGMEKQDKKKRSHEGSKNEERKKSRRKSRMKRSNGGSKNEEGKKRRRENETKEQRKEGIRGKRR